MQQPAREVLLGARCGLGLDLLHRGDFLTERVVGVGRDRPGRPDVAVGVDGYLLAFGEVDVPALAVHVEAADEELDHDRSVGVDQHLEQRASHRSGGGVAHHLEGGAAYKLLHRVERPAELVGHRDVVHVPVLGEVRRVDCDLCVVGQARDGAIRELDLGPALGVRLDGIAWLNKGAGSRRGERATRVGDTRVRHERGQHRAHRGVG